MHRSVQQLSNRRQVNALRAVEQEERVERVQSTFLEYEARSAQFSSGWTFPDIHDVGNSVSTDDKAN
jgi:hypothetical protein